MLLLLLLPLFALQRALLRENTAFLKRGASFSRRQEPVLPAAASAFSPGGAGTEPPAAQRHGPSDPALRAAPTGAAMLVASPGSWGAGDENSLFVDGGRGDERGDEARVPRVALPPLTALAPAARGGGSGLPAAVARGSSDEGDNDSGGSGSTSRSNDSSGSGPRSARHRLVRSPVTPRDERTHGAAGVEDGTTPPLRPLRDAWGAPAGERGPPPASSPLRQHWLPTTAKGASAAGPDAYGGASMREGLVAHRPDAESPRRRVGRARPASASHRRPRSLATADPEGDGPSGAAAGNEPTLQPRDWATDALLSQTVAALAARAAAWVAEAGDAAGLEAGTQRVGASVATALVIV